jgi:hypothetical protein
MLEEAFFLQFASKALKVMDAESVPLTDDNCWSIFSQLQPSMTFVCRISLVCRFELVPRFCRFQDSLCSLSLLSCSRLRAQVWSQVWI